MKRRVNVQKARNAWEHLTSTTNSARLLEQCTTLHKCFRCTKLIAWLTTITYVQQKNPHITIGFLIGLVSQRLVAVAHVQNALMRILSPWISHFFYIPTRQIVTPVDLGRRLCSICASAQHILDFDELVQEALVFGSQIIVMTKPTSALLCLVSLQYTPQSTLRDTVYIAQLHECLCPFVHLAIVM